jgi:hypothetical protein
MIAYAPPGIAGADSRAIKEPLKLLGNRATTDPGRTIQKNHSEKA